MNIFAKFHENRTQHFSRNHELTNERTQPITNERMKQTTNKQAQPMTVPPDRSNNSQARREGEGKVFTGPATFGGPAIAQKYSKHPSRVSSLFGVSISAHTEGGCDTARR